MEQPATRSSIVATPPARSGGGSSEGEGAEHRHRSDHNTPKMTMYRGVWLDESHLPLVKAVHEVYQARSSDIVLATFPKSGTTWLKALAYAIAFRELYRPLSPEHPLLTNNPHELVPVLEFPFFWKNRDLESLPSPRLIQTHLPYRLLPESAMAPLGSGGCRLIYLCREPKDAFVSWAHFVKQVKSPIYDTNLTTDQLFDIFCNGVEYFGAFWDHVREFWEQNNKEPEKVLFFKYEDMLRDPSTAAKRLAEFIGFPFSGEEVDEGVVEDVVKLCSFENMKKLGVNKDGFLGDGVNVKVKNPTYFRNGKVGDWRNHMTQEMAKKVDDIVKDKLHDTGLVFGE